MAILNNILNIGPDGLLLIEAAIIEVSLDKTGKSDRKKPGEKTQAPDYLAVGAEVIGKSNLCSISEFQPYAMTNALGEITNRL